jgi:hypothetical protein
MDMLGNKIISAIIKQVEVNTGVSIQVDYSKGHPAIKFVDLWDALIELDIINGIIRASGGNAESTHCMIKISLANPSAIKDLETAVLVCRKTDECWKCPMCKFKSE